MSGKIQIDISKLFGIYRAIADKANFDHNEYLEGSEISIFNITRKTINNKQETFIFDNKLYDANGEEYKPNLKYEPVSTKVFGYKNQEVIVKYNEQAVELSKADKYDIRQNIGYVTTNYTGKEERIIYNRQVIEDYVINDGVDKYGNKITYFSKIPEIREKKEAERTLEEKALLDEFNNMMNYILDAAKQYGVDPKAIIAIIQQEVCFDGNGKERKVTGRNGQGYMQITSIPIEDYLGLDGYNMLKNSVYSKDMQELLESRGFKVWELDDKKCPKSKRKKMAKDIMDYLRKNKDPEFNIKLGTILLRHHLEKAKGDIKEAALHYNASKKHKYAYCRNVDKYYKRLSNKQKDFEA